MPVTPQRLIRNFSIIAHIDHGKSTLADRILEVTGALTEREKREQFLDKMDLERERGITIKAQTVRLSYTAKDGEVYELNLIDTPGHVDFNYEVSRSLAACEGALLVVDATQGVEAQTLANVYLALDKDLEIIPVLNKIDLPLGDVDGTQARRSRRSSASTARRPSRQRQDGRRRPARSSSRSSRRSRRRKGKPDAPLRALIFDSWYDSYRGAVVMVRVVDGIAEEGRQDPLHGDEDRLRGRPRSGVFTPLAVAARGARPGRGRLRRREHQERPRHEDRRHGDPRRQRAGRTAPHGPATEPLPGFKDVKPMVFAGIFPTDCAEYPQPARRAREAAHERRGVQLRARHVGGARLRLPLRLPRAAPHGDHPGAARARVQPRPHHDGAERRLPRATRRDGDDGHASRTRRSCRRRRCIERIEEPIVKLDDPRAGGVRRRRARALRGAARRRRRACSTPSADRVHHHLRAAARRGALRLPRQAEERLARLRLDGLRAHRLPRRTTS